MIFMKWKIGLQLLIGVSEILILVLTVINHSWNIFKTDGSLGPCIGAIWRVGMYNIFHNPCMVS